VFEKLCTRVRTHAHTCTHAHIHTYTHTHAHTVTLTHAHSMWGSLAEMERSFSLFVGSTVLFVRGLYGTLCSWALRYSLFVGSTVAVDYIVHICSTLSTYMVDLDH